MTTVGIKSIERYQYTGKVYNVEVEPNHPTKDDQYYIHAENGLVVHNCHPRDNIALRYLAEKLDLGYDLFSTIMGAREQQAKNLALFLDDLSDTYDLPIYIMGKAYKPAVDILDGSYSLLIGHYLTELESEFQYIDPLTNPEFVPLSIKGVVLLAHSPYITYGYTGDQEMTNLYCGFDPGTVVVDPWRMYKTLVPDIKVVHYGNTRNA